MPEYTRLESRRIKRRGSSWRTWLGAGVLLAIVLGGLAWWLIASLGRSAPSPDSQSSVTTSTSRSTPATSSAPPGKQPPGSTASSTEASANASPSVASAANASVTAAEKAAVRFPGAPALSSTTPSINHGTPHHKYIAITLDDGYNFQPALLGLFKQYDVHCTTFLIGSWAATHKADLKLMKEAGFEIANHSWSHPFLTRLSSAAIATELTKTQKVITSVTGSQAPYLRPPFGATNASVKAAAARLGYRIVMWDRTFGDSGRGATPKKLYSNVMSSGGGVKPGDIILCHWGSKPSYEALKKILPDLRAQGYEFVTLSELIADSK